MKNRRLDRHKPGICIDCRGSTARTRNERCISCVGKQRQGKNLIERTCLQCKKKFLVWPSTVKLGRANHCSKSCRGKTDYLTRIKFQLAGRLIRSNQSGEKNPMWKGGITPFQRAFRTSTPYKLWRKTVFERDDYICQFCGQRAKELHADHIKSFSGFPLLRLDINNGRTLCIECHRKTPTWGNKTEIYL